MTPKLVYEDRDIIVIDKPAGLTAHASSENDKRGTVASFLVAHCPDTKNVGENPLRPGIVHRLDKETSGLMVVAKNNETFFELKKQFQERKVEKKYIALVSGILERDHGVINTPLVKMGTRTRTSITSSESSRAAVTEYKVIERYKDYTLVEVRPKTGRQHQIRVHFTSINHPVACDKLYGRRAKKCPPGLARHFLHASYLKFQLKSALMEFESELPDDLGKSLNTIT
ncbi:MAG: RluA family pseudouridine synthase [Candidatus Spechtbacterales bacterium]